MLFPRKFLCVLLAAFVWLIGPSAASARQDHQVQATADTVSASQSGTIASVQLKVTVANGGSALAGDVWVKFPDGTEVSVGDVAAQGSAVSEKHTVTIDLAERPSRSHVLPVTILFTVDGTRVEVKQPLLVQLPASEGDAR